MTAVLIALLLIVCGVLGWRWRCEKFARRQDMNAVEKGFTAWIAEVKGRYDELVSARQEQFAGVSKERDAFRDLTTKWQTHLESIQASLKDISTNATGKVDNLASALKPIVSIFRSPQAAGIEFGEAELEMILSTHLGTGLYLKKPRLLAVGQEVVDFAIKLPDCVVPIDCKFPSASYRAWVDASSEEDAKTAWRMFRNQILEQLAETAKYIKPDAGTTDYALLFVPSDVIYQQAFLTQRVYEQDNPIPKRSHELQVFGCSTQTLMPYFGLIRLGLRNLKISEDVKEIRHQIEQLEVIFKTFSGDWDILRGHVSRLTKHVDQLSGERSSSLSGLREAIKRLTAPQASREKSAAPLSDETAVQPELVRTSEGAPT